MVGGGGPYKARPGSLLSGGAGHFSALLVSYPPSSHPALICGSSQGCCPVLLLQGPQNGGLWVWRPLARPHRNPSKADSRDHCAPLWVCSHSQFKEGWYLIFNYSLLFLIITGFKFCFWIRNDNIKSPVQDLFYWILPWMCWEVDPLLNNGGLKWGKQKNCFCCCLTKCNTHL